MLPPVVWYFYDSVLAYVMSITRSPFKFGLCSLILGVESFNKGLRKELMLNLTWLNYLQEPNTIAFSMW